jgi:hypothetical protein
MKNKPYPALLGGSFLFNEIKKRTPKSRETIPLNAVLQILAIFINIRYRLFKTFGSTPHIFTFTNFVLTLFWKSSLAFTLSQTSCV